MKNYKTIIAAVVAGVALTAVTSQAALVTGSLVNQTLFQQPGSSTGGNTGDNDGIVSSWVISGYSGNVNGLTFVFQVVNKGPDTTTQDSFSNFGGTFLSAGSTTTSTFFDGLVFGSAVSGSSSFSSVNAITPGGSVGFNATTVFNGTSDYFYINTSAKTFSAGSAREQDGFQAIGATLAPVPEPSTVVAGALMLLPFGIGAIRSLRKDRTA